MFMQIPYVRQTTNGLIVTFANQWCNFITPSISQGQMFAFMGLALLQLSCQTEIRIMTLGELSHKIWLLSKNHNSHHEYQHSDRVLQFDCNN
mgnify:CR=1 FL=1